MTSAACCPAVGALISVADIDPVLYEPPLSNPLAMVLMISGPRKPARVAACIRAAIAARSLTTPLAIISPARQAAQYSDLFRSPSFRPDTNRVSDPRPPAVGWSMGRGGAFGLNVIVNHRGGLSSAALCGAISHS